MIFLGTIKNLSVEKNRNSENNNRMLSCEISSPEDIQSVEQVNDFGEDSVGFSEDTVLVIPVSEAYKLGIMIDDGIEPDNTLLEGEKKIYSRSDKSTVAAKIYLKNDGSIELNNNTDFAVAFLKLKAEFEELQTKFNTHVHPGVAAGGANTGVTVQQSLADIDNAKVDKVKL